MQKFIVDSWNVVMDNKLNPLSAVPDMGVRHMVMQILAWMWCIIFSIYVGSFVVFGISAIAHILLISGLFITAITFKLAKDKPEIFTGGLGRARGGEHE